MCMSADDVTKNRGWTFSKQEAEIYVQDTDEPQWCYVKDELSWNDWLD